MRTPNSGSPFFVVETFAVEDNRSLVSPTPDKDGYYCGVPMAVLGTVTRNNTKYDIQSVLDSIRAEDSAFRMRLTEGNLFGEWGHPIADFNTEFGMYRLLNLDPTKESHHFRKVYVEHIEDLGCDVVFADIKPSGPYGKFFEEKMSDPTRNLAFSLRSISRELRDPRGVAQRKVIKMVTFDAGMASGGYKEASKRYMISTESFQCSSAEDMRCVIDHGNLLEMREASIESFSQSELNDVIKSNRVTLKHTVSTFVDRENKVLLDIAGRKECGIMHSFLKSR